MFFRYLVPCFLASSATNAEVCDRDEYPLSEWLEAEEPVRENRIDFTYESGVIVYEDGARETVYCIRNDAAAPVFVKWHGPKPGLLFDSYATGHGLKADKGQKTYESTDERSRTMEYGPTRNHGRQVDADTLTFTKAEASSFYYAQATPIDVVGVTLPEALADPAVLDTYMAAYQSAPEGGNEISIYSYSRNWLPADTAVLAQLAAGEESDEFDGPYFQVSFGIRSVIDINTKTATSSLQFWYGHYEANIEALEEATQSEVRSRLALISSAGQLTGLSELEADHTLPLSETNGFLQQEVLQAKVGDDSSAQIVPWVVGLAFDGVPLTAIQGEVIAN